MNLLIGRIEFVSNAEIQSQFAAQFEIVLHEGLILP